MNASVAAVADAHAADATRRRKLVLSSLVLACACAAAYAPSLRADFIADDRFLVADNPAIRDLRNVPGFFVTTPPDPIVSNFYRPVMMASFAVDHALFGLRPGGYHATNVLLHVLASLFVLRLLLALGLELFAALPAALLFALHPVQGEAVNIVNYRATILAALFFLAALHFHLTSRARPFGVRESLILGALYFAAAASKEIGVMLPAAMLACDLLLPAQGKPRLLPYVTTGCVALGYFALRHVLCTPQSFAYFAGVPPGELLLTMTVVEAHALSLLVFPRSLASVYDASFLPHVGTLADPRFWSAALVLGLIVLLGVRLRRRAPLASLAVALGCVTLAPTWQLLGLLPVMFGERFLYLPVLGLSLLVALAIRRPTKPRARQAAVAVTLGLLAVCGVRAHARTAEFRDEAAFWRAQVKARPESVQARIGYATTLRKQSRCREALPHYVFAMQHADRSRRAARPIFGEAASCYSLGGDARNALATVEAWLASHPDDAGFLQMQRALERATQAPRL